MAKDPVEFQAELDAIEAEAGESTEGVEETITAFDDEEEVEIFEEEDEVPQAIDEPEAPEIIEKTDKGPMIPKGRFDEVNSQMQQLRDENIRIQTQMQMMQQKPQQETKVESNPYDPDIEETEYLGWELKQTKKEIAELRQGLTGQAQQTQQQQQKQYYEQTRNVQIQQGGAYDALVFLASKKAEEFRNAGMEENYIPQALENYVSAFANPAIDKGQNVADKVNALAKGFGYNPMTPKTPNLDAIARNKSKSASTASSQSVPTSPSGSLTSVKTTFNENGRGVNADSFQKYLKSIT